MLFAAIAFSLSAAPLATAPPAKQPLASIMASPTIAVPKGLTGTRMSFGSTVTIVVANVKAPAARKTKPPTAASLELGKTLYAQRCVLCHGDAGAADGVGARRLQPRPQHLNDVIWQGAVDDNDIKKAILEGGAAVSRSPMMPANPDLKKKPKSVQALVDYVRALRAPFGSVTATVTQPDGTSATLHAVADDKGTATIVVPAVPSGAFKALVQIDEAGTVGCTLDVVVKGDITLPCG